MADKQENAQTNFYQNEKKDSPVKNSSIKNKREDLPAVTEGTGSDYSSKAESLKERKTSGGKDAKSQSDVKEAENSQTDNSAGMERSTTSPDKSIPGSIAGHEEEDRKSEAS